MANFESQAVLIIGAGHGCIEMIKLFQDDSPFHIIGIADTNPDAPAFKLASQLNIPQFTDVNVALQHCKPCTALNLTHDEQVSAIAAEIIGASSIIGGHESALIWKMVNDAKNARDKLQENQLLTESIITHALEAIIMIDSKGILSKFNPSAEKIFGYSKAEVLGQNINILMPEPDKTSHDGYLQRYLNTHQARVVGIRREVTALRKNGETFPISLSVNEIRLADQTLFVGIVSDITERKKQENIIKHQAHFDALTDLPNRVLFFDRCKSTLALAKRHKQKMAILFLDLDGFKQINDTLGHKCGDLLLQQVAQRLQASIREVDTVARFGGDEFAFVLNDIKNATTVSAIAKKIVAQLSKLFILDEHSCQISGSIGISIYPDNDTSLDNLIHQADTAMYSVKKSGKNRYQFYDNTMQPY